MKVQKFLLDLSIARQENGMYKDNIELQRNYRLYDKATIVRNGHSYFGRITTLSIDGLWLTDYDDKTSFFKWEQIFCICSHGY